MRLSGQFPKVWFQTFIIVLLMVFLTVSCSESSLNTEDLAPVTLTVSERGKALQSSSYDFSQDIDSYWFTATPQFTGHSVGTVTTAKKIIPSVSGTANLGMFTQGEWTFTVYGKNSSSQTICQGSATASLIQGKANVIPIILKHNSSGADGTLSIDVNTPSYGSGESKLIMKYRKAGDSDFTVLNSGWTSSVANNKVNYKWTNTFAPGFYEISLQYYYNNMLIGGQTVTTGIYSGKTSSISGDMEAGINVKAGIQINFGVTSSTNIEEVYELLTNEQQVFYWVDTSAQGLIYSWTVNGSEVPCTSSSYTFCQSEVGTYTLTCTAKSENSMQSATYVITVDDSFKIHFFQLRSGVSGKTMNTGYTKDSETVEFPYSTTGSKTNTSYEDLGFSTVTIKPTSYIAINTITYLETATEYGMVLQSGKSLFNGSYSNKDWTLKEAVIRFTEVPRNCLWYSVALETVVLTDSVDIVNAVAFANCTSLKEVYIGDVSSIASSTFDGCTALKTVYLKNASWPEDWALTAEKITGLGATIKYSQPEGYFRDN